MLQSVVSAFIEPDTIIMSRSLNDKVLKVQEIKLGSKQEGIMLSQGMLDIIYINHEMTLM
jgi:hypothetical protein